jgi:Transposase zinc-binding domain
MVYLHLQQIRRAAIVSPFDVLNNCSMSAAISAGLQLQQLFGHACTRQCNGYSQHIFNQLHLCHTAAMGMHHYACSDTNCNHLHRQYHSCGNRHCPNCGGLKKEL